MVHQNSCEQRTMALHQAVRVCGSIGVLGMKIHVERSVINKWINQPNRTIPYNKAILIEKVTGVSVERILPDEKEVNEYYRKGGAINTLILRDILINKIIITDLPCLSYPRSDRHIIIDVNGVLISGLVELKAYKKVKTDQIQVVILDLESLILGIYQIKDLSNKFLISERVAIGLRLEKLLGNRQGQRNDLELKLSNIKTNEKLFKFAGLGYKIRGRTEEKIAAVIGFSKDSYRRAKQIYLHGSEELIQALDRNHISIKKAAIISKVFKDQQYKFIKQPKKENIYVKNQNSKTRVV